MGPLVLVVPWYRGVRTCPDGARSLARIDRSGCVHLDMFETARGWGEDGRRRVGRVSGSAPGLRGRCGNVLARTTSWGSMARLGRPGGRPALDQVQQQGDAPLAHRREVLPDGGERRSEELRLRDVVEADHRDVLGSAYARLTQRPQHPQRHLVVGDEDGGQTAAHPAGQFLARTVARQRTPVPPQRRRRLDARRFEGRPPAGGPVHRLLPVLGPGEMPDRAVAGGQQMTGRQPRAQLLVHVDAGDLHAGAGAHGHHREGVAQFGEGLDRRPLRGEGDHALHPAVAEVVQGLGQRLHRQFAQADRRDEVALGARRLLQREQRAGRPVERGVGGDHTQGQGAPGRQGPGGGVAAVAHLLDGAQHPGPRLVPHVGVVPQHAGDGLVGHAGQACHVGHGGRPELRVGRVVWGWATAAPPWRSSADRSCACGRMSPRRRLHAGIPESPTASGGKGELGHCRHDAHTSSDAIGRRTGECGGHCER